MPGAHTHARRGTTQVLGIQFHGIFKREEQSDDIRKVPRIEIQISEPRILVQRVLRRYSGQNAKKIEEYIRRQLEEDKAGEQLTMGNI